MHSALRSSLPPPSGLTTACLPPCRRGGSGARPPWLGCEAGLTLIELMVTLAVGVVLMAVAVPSGADFLANNQVSGARTALSGAVGLARTEATKRGKTVFLQAIGDGPSGNEFVNGWEVVVDDDGNGLAGANETRVRRGLGGQDKISLSGPPSLAFRASGALVGQAAAVYTLCRLNGSPAGYTLTVTPSGVADVAAITTCH